MKQMRTQFEGMLADNARIWGQVNSKLAILVKQAYGIIRTRQNEYQSYMIIVSFEDNKHDNLPCKN